MTEFVKTVREYWPTVRLGTVGPDVRVTDLGHWSLADMAVGDVVL
jgi:hypothetical protein